MFTVRIDAIFVLFSLYYVNGYSILGKVIPLQARCGPEGV